MSLVEQFYIQLAGEAFIVKVRDHSMLTEQILNVLMLRRILVCELYVLSAFRYFLSSKFISAWIVSTVAFLVCSVGVMAYWQTDAWKVYHSLLNIDDEVRHCHLKYVSR